MTRGILLMSGGVRFVLILLIVLVLGGGIAIVVLKEQQRKAKAKARAEERRKMREEALQRARSGQVNPFQTMSTVSQNPAIPIQTPESVREMSQTQWTQRVETRTDNLNTLLNFGEPAEEKKEVKEQAASPAPAEPETVPAPREERSIVNFRALADRLDSADGTEPSEKAESAEISAENAAASSDGQSETDQAGTEAASAEAASAAVAAAAMKAKAEADAIDCTPNFRTEAVTAEPDSAFRPYKDEYEDMAADYEKQAVREENRPAAAAEAVRMPSLTEDQTMLDLSDLEEETAAPAADEPAEQAADVTAEYFTEQPADMTAEHFTEQPADAQPAAEQPEESPVPESEPVSAAEAAAPTAVFEKPIDEQGRTPAPGSAEDAAMDFFAMPSSRPAVPEKTAPNSFMDGGETKAFNFPEPDAEQPNTAPVRETSFVQPEQPQASQNAPSAFEQSMQRASEQVQRETILKQQQEDILNMSTASFEALKLSPEEREAAKAARMAEKARYAAALAGEIDINEYPMPGTSQNGYQTQAGGLNRQPVQPNTAYGNVPMGPSLLDDEDDDDEGVEEGGKGSRIFLWIMAILLVLICIGSAVYLFFGSQLFGNKDESSSLVIEESSEVSHTVIQAESSEVPEESSEESSEEESSEPEPEPTPVYTTFVEEPHYVESTNPENWGVTQLFMASGEEVDSIDREDKITFGTADEYTDVAGVTTFRGNNFRNDAAYGTADITEEEFNGADWVDTIGGLADSDGDVWSGCGWTGQPLIIQWDDDVKATMDTLYDEKKEKEGFTEVIYATMDGYVYFYDLDDGSYSRDPLDLGMTFKGAGALDPRGIPLLYVGSGVYNSYGESPHIFVVSLVTGETLYECGPYDDISHREWPAFDSSPILDAETDTLIWPGENGVFYTIKLNTQYDASTGELTVDPDQVAKMSYETSRSSTSSYWLGMECSVACFDHYAYFSENGGMFFCMDLNTMQIVWAQDTLDDSNSTPVFEFDETTGRGYVYTAPSLHWTRDGDTGNVPIFKLDAITGEIIWQNDYYCYTITEISGGVQSTPAIGRAGTELEGMIFYTIARWEGYYDGLLVALDTETGEEVWRWEMGDYTWSSPVAVYTDEGEGYLVVFDSEGDGYLIDGTNGDILDTCSVGWLVEASPAAYEDKIVVGTRGSEIYCIDLE